MHEPTNPKFKLVSPFVYDYRMFYHHWYLL